MQEKIEQAASQLFLGLLKDNDDVDEFCSFDEDAHVVHITLFVNGPDFEISVPDFLQYAEEVKTMIISTGDGRITTAKRTLQLLQAQNERATAINYHEREIATRHTDGITLSIKHNSFLVWYAVVKVGADKGNDLILPGYIAAEVYYEGSMKKLGNDIETNLIASYLFELAASYDIVYSKDSFIPIDDQDDWPSTVLDQNQDIVLRPLEEYNEGIGLYLAAQQVADPELHLLSLYKVLEYFAPVVFNLESNEALRRKLESPKVLSPDNEYIQSVFSLVRSIDRRKTDKEMIRSVFDRCIDVIELSVYLPKHLKRDISYDSKKSDIENFSRQIAETLVATRNQVAHAKSNYQPQGLELKHADLQQFNEFLQAAAVQAIRWYNRLPSFQKLGTET